MPADKKGIILECDDTGNIINIVFNTLEADTTGWAGFSVFSLFDSDSLENGLYFWESVGQFGHAEAWPVALYINNTRVPLTFTGARMGYAFMLMGYESDGEIITLSQTTESADTSVTTLPQPGITSEIPEHEILDELSRLNNELVNAKRELIRQNVKLKRLQNPWDQGLTFI